MNFQLDDLYWMLIILAFGIGAWLAGYPQERRIFIDSPWAKIKRRCGLLWKSGRKS